ncbi:MAG: hypothetical protein RLZZ508_254 [Actinomycetota bacterium]|jgi:hypothetical protein
MEIIAGLVLVLHFIGLGSLLGGFLTQVSESVVRITRAMVDGAWTMLVTGFVLIYFAMQEAADNNEEFPHTKFGIKGLIIAVILILVMQSRKKESIEKGTFLAIGLLTITNIVIAVLV